MVHVGRLSHHEAQIHVVEVEEILGFQDTPSVEILLTIPHKIKHKK